MSSANSTATVTRNIPTMALNRYDGNLASLHANGSSGLNCGLLTSKLKKRKTKDRLALKTQEGSMSLTKGRGWDNVELIGGSSLTLQSSHA